MTLRLFRVILTQEYVAEQHALVYANSRNDAESAALDEADFSFSDAEECGGPDARVIPVQPDDIPRLTSDQFSFCLVPPPPPEGEGNWWQEIDFPDLMEMITPAQVQAWRIEQIERNNGQMCLLEDQP